MPNTFFVAICEPSRNIPRPNAEAHHRKHKDFKPAAIPWASATFPQQPHGSPTYIYIHLIEEVSCFSCEGYIYVFVGAESTAQPFHYAVYRGPMAELQNLEVDGSGQARLRYVLEPCP